MLWEKPSKVYTLPTR